VDQRGGKSKPIKPAMGAALPSCTYNLDGDQEIVVLGAQWMPVVGRIDTNHDHVDP